MSQHEGTRLIMSFQQRYNSIESSYDVTSRGIIVLLKLSRLVQMKEAGVNRNVLPKPASSVCCQNESDSNIATGSAIRLH